MIIGTQDPYTYNLLQKTADFGKELRKYSPQFSLHLFQVLLYALGQSESFGMCARCHVVELTVPVFVSHPGRLKGKMTTLGKSGQVYSAFSLRLLVKEKMGVLDTKTLPATSLPSLHLVERGS